MEYDVVIGLEIHVQVKTKSKMFCGCKNEYGAEPNTNVCPICLGYPGVLPVTNAEMVKKTALAGLMIECEIAKFNKFDRKSYFYPDQAKNYQITQADLPICLEGKIHLSGKGFSGKMLPNKTIRVERIHMEEDVAKSTHFDNCSGIDFNRAGVPLMEIVSHPDMASADEAYAYLTAIKQTMQYGGISSCDQEKGQMRCDVNISLKPKGAKELGTKTELKNLNSFRNVHLATEYEIKRQQKILNEGGKIIQETRGWNAEKQATYQMRVKESANDYRYFPEPDLLPVTFTDEQIETIRQQMPELPAQRQKRYIEELGLPEYDAQVLTTEKAMSDFFDETILAGADPKTASNWIMSELMRELNDSNISLNKCKISAQQFAALLQLIAKKVINGKIAKTVFSEMFATGNDPKAIVEEKGLVQVTDTSAIEAFVDQAIAANPGPVEQYKEGKPNVDKFLVGQVMKLSRGKANPAMVIEMIKNKLG
jgi:aspartyl-tRNA(Asn)/glutamyl-tRNA(Gln) amidotransferase subunit B